jgi:rhodanese-related sulfurtransferase
MFLKIGKWFLLFAKFFPALSTISVAMAGITEMPMTTFLVLSGAGALLFVIVAVATGWIFHDAIMDVLNTIAAVGKVGLLSAILAVCLYSLARWWRRQAFIRQLRMDRITVADLRRLIDEGRKPLILDVRPKEVRTRAGTIPGAIAADLIASAATYSRDREIVVYCACPNEASAALAAKHLKQAGFKKIRPLLGGIDAWIQAGGPLEPPCSLAPPANQPPIT